MILRDLATSVRKQTWFSVVIKTLIVVMCLTPVALADDCQDNDTEAGRAVIAAREGTDPGVQRGAERSLFLRHIDADLRSGTYLSWRRSRARRDGG